jgi:ABC-type nitrate/sulfonate/bicarbonate transport system substrate-binding protein
VAPHLISTDHQASKDTIMSDTEILFTRCGGATASTIAIQRGFLHDEFASGGAVLRSLQESGDAAVRESHFDHSIPSMFREGGNIPPIWARARGADTVVLAISWVDEFQSVVVRTGSAIRTLADLAGKRLAVPLYEGISIDFQRGANFHGLASALAIAGLGRDDVTFVDVPVERGQGFASGAAELAALFDGRVDAVFLRQSSGLRLLRQHSQGLHELVRLTDEPNPLHRVNNGTPRPLTVHRSFLDQHRPLVVRYIAALLRAAEWAEANPDDALYALTEEDGRSDRETIAATFPRYATSLRPRLTDEYVAGLSAQKDFLFAWGFLEADFDVADWIERGPLAEAEALVSAETSIAAE